MLHDVQDGKIKVIVCYKLDRFGRKTANLIHLMNFLKMYHVDLLIWSNGINTASGLYKIFIQIFAVIADFERDTLTKRIVDNMMELAKDGRRLGGNTPRGFTVRRVIKGKISIYLLRKLTGRKTHDSAFVWNFPNHPQYPNYCKTDEWGKIPHSFRCNIQRIYNKKYFDNIIKFKKLTDYRITIEPIRKSSNAATAYWSLRNMFRLLKVSLSASELIY